MLRPNPSSKKALELPHLRPERKLSRVQHLQHGQILSFPQYRFSQRNRAVNVGVTTIAVQLSEGRDPGGRPSLHGI
jgi:hypothetical protein